jgi:hypothetical protein
MSQRSPDTARLQQMNTLLEAGLALPEAEREAWLRGLPAEHAALVPLLRTLLQRASVETDDFMRKPIGLLPPDLDDAPAMADRAGDLIGPYRLLQQLGAGGMATVWLAERADGALQRQVALKLPRRSGSRSAWRASATSSPRSSTRTSRGCTTPAPPRRAGPGWRWSASKACRSMRTAASNGSTSMRGCGCSCRWPMQCRTRTRG